MCGSMVDIQSATAEKRRGKKEEREKERNEEEEEETARVKYYGTLLWAAITSVLMFCTVLQFTTTL